MYKTASDIHITITAVKEQQQKMMPTDRDRNESKQGASPLVQPQQQSSRTSNASSFLKWRSHRTHEQSQISRDPLRQNADVQDTGQNNKTQVQERTVHADAVAGKGIGQRHLFLPYQSAIQGVVDYGLGLTTPSQPNVLKLDRVQNEDTRVILETTKDTSIETMPPMETRHKVEQVKAYLHAMRNPNNPFHDAIKEEAGYRLAQCKSWMVKKNSQSSLWIASHSWSK